MAISEYGCSLTKIPLLFLNSEVCYEFRRLQLILGALFFLDANKSQCPVWISSSGSTYPTPHRIEFPVFPIPYAYLNISIFCLLKWVVRSLMEQKSLSQMHV